MSEDERQITSIQGVCLETYINERFKACQETREKLFKGSDRALDLARDSMEKRLEGMNEFRDTLRDQASRFITRNELLGLVIGLSTVISIIISLIAMLVRR